MPDIGFSLQKQYDRPLTQVIPLLKEAGFFAVSPLWSPELDLGTLAACVRSHGMKLQSLHAPHKGSPELWSRDPALSQEVTGRFLRCIDDCARFDIPILVVHSWQGLFYTFRGDDLHFESFDRIVAHAQAHGVAVAFENLDGEEYLHALMARYSHLPHVGFCWDSGHDHCFPHKTDFLQTFGHRLIMTHLNDNWGLRDPNGIPCGDDDLHFLPFDGNLDWDSVLEKLKAAPTQSILNFELKLTSHSKRPGDLLYKNTPLEAFLKEAGSRARLIAEKYANV